MLICFKSILKGFEFVKVDLTRAQCIMRMISDTIFID